MFFNFCDPRLRPEIQCSAVSTEGYEVTNLISDNDKGFLAYSCIKPPVNIDITFLCNVCINHVLVWPYVGSQKSSGFQLFAKTSNDGSVPYVQLCSGFLDNTNGGVMFYPFHVKHEAISAPANFLKRYIKPSFQYLTMYTSNLRISICKTENSVPAVGRIEVWGTVSPRCGKDIVASVYTLWSKQVLAPEAEERPRTEEKKRSVDVINKREVVESSLEIPECFLDPITCEIMTQPVLMPSGKIIDQTTLEKHEENEALWGRPPSDPFTAITFNENRKPIVATALKARIDKFLLENSDDAEVKKLPRVLGRASYAKEKAVSLATRSSFKRNALDKSGSDTVVRPHVPVPSLPKKKEQCHRLPVVLMCPRQNSFEKARPVKRKRTTITSEQAGNNDVSDVGGSEQSEKDVDVNALVPNLKRFDAPQPHEEHSVTNSCDCCANSIFYELPCKHVICRKKLLTGGSNKCGTCDRIYKTSEVKRVHE